MVTSLRFFFVDTELPMNIRSLSLLFLAVALVPSSAVAQMGIVKGTVVDQDGEIIAGAVVTFDYLGELNRKFETKTNDKGRYTQVVNSGRYRITASSEGYRPAFFDQRIPSGPARELDDLKIFNIAVLEERALAPILKKFDAAGALSRAGKLDEALAIYEELRVENDTVPELHFNMGALHARKQDWPAAEAAFLRTLELKPQQLNAALALASVLENLDRKGEADALLEKLALEHPDNIEVLYGLAVGFVNAQRNDEAQVALEKVIQLDPKKAEAYYLLASIALNKGEIDEALGLLEKYLELAPADARYREPAEQILAQLKPAQQ